MSATDSTLDRRSQRRLRAAEGYLMLDMFEHALRELRTIPDPSGHLFHFHLLRAEAYRGLAQWWDALEDYRVCQQLQANDLGVLMGLAWCHKRTRDLTQAIAAMHDAYRAHPEVPVVLYNLACYYSLARQTGQAVTWLARALRMDPELRRLIPEETDFDPIRAAPEFRKLLEMSE
jgi:tetratricopeptide (TPR) repeat protein